MSSAKGDVLDELVGVVQAQASPATKQLSKIGGMESRATAVWIS